MSLSHHAFLISSLIGPYSSDERISLLSHRISLFVHQDCCLPLISNKPVCICVVSSCLGSSTSSIVWNGSATVETALVFPFRTSSTWFLLSNSWKRYSSGNGLLCSRCVRISRFWASVSWSNDIVIESKQLKADRPSILY